MECQGKKIRIKERKGGEGGREKKDREHEWKKRWERRDGTEKGEGEGDYRREGERETASILYYRVRKNVSLTSCSESWPHCIKEINLGSLAGTQKPSDLCCSETESLLVKRTLFLNITDRRGNANKPTMRCHLTLVIKAITKSPHTIIIFIHIVLWIVKEGK